MTDRKEPLLQQVAPRSIVYGRLLLTIQACLWAPVLVSAAAIAATNVQPGAVHHSAAHAAVFVTLSLVALLFMLGMSAASAYLAANLEQGRATARQAAFAVEVFMACFGLLIAYVGASSGAGVIAGLPVLAGLAGATLSLTAAVGLLGKAARDFCRSVRSA